MKEEDELMTTGEANGYAQSRVKLHLNKLQETPRKSLLKWKFGELKQVCGSLLS